MDKQRNNQKYGILSIILFKTFKFLSSHVYLIKSLELGLLGLKHLKLLIIKVFPSIFFKIPPQITKFAQQPKKHINIDAKNDIKFVHFIGTLGPGGTERQLCNLVCGIKKIGYKNIKIITLPIVGSDAHYSPRLIQSNINLASLDFSSSYPPHPAISLMPIELRQQILAIYTEISKDIPHVFHAWLDYSNTLGGIAALLAGVPVIVLSTRSVSPKHFPHMFCPWFREYYKFLATYSNVHFINNSINGARDYERWLGLPENKFKVIYNGVDFDEIESQASEEKNKIRRDIGIPEDAIAICGIFRLSAEKRPEMFFEITGTLMEKFPQLYIVHAGDGSRALHLKRKNKFSKNKSRLLILGIRDDIVKILKACDILLLTSKNEGTPNVILEAASVGIPVVATNVGGIPECIENGVTGFTHDIYDKNGISNSLVRLIENEELRKRMSLASKAFVQKKFTINQMISKTLDLYKS